MDQATQDELIANLRAGDPDRLYIALFASGKARERLLSLFAFNLEIASTRERVSETMLGQIRLQWWRDALEEIRRGEPRRHPVVAAMAEWIPDAGNKAFDLANAMIDAREADLEEQPFETMAQLVSYASDTSANLLHLALLAEGITDEAGHNKASNAGIAYALTGIIRAVPFLGAQGRVLLPGQLLAAHGIADARQSLGQRDPDKLRNALQQIASRAETHLKEVGHQRGSSVATRPFILHAALAQLYLARIRKSGFDLSDPRMDPGPARRILTLLKTRLVGQP